MLIILAWLGVALVVGGIACVLAVFQGDVDMTSRLHSLVAGIACLTVGGLAVGCWMLLHAMEAWTTPRPVAEVWCRWTEESNHEFELTYRPVAGSAPQPSVTAKLRGDQWTISGSFVQWAPWVVSLGVPSYHKPTRLSGRFTRVSDELEQPPTTKSLDRDFDVVWQFFYWFDEYLPFVNGVYGSAAFAPVDPGATFIVNVSPSGYWIDRRR